MLTRPAPSRYTLRMKIRSALLGFLCLVSVASADPTIALSNLEQASSTPWMLNYGDLYAQQFHVGDTDFDLNYVVVQADFILDELNISLWSNTSGAPGVKLVDFEPIPEDFVGGFFTINLDGPSSYLLSSDTDYWLVYSTEGAFSMGNLTDSASWDFQSPGWSAPLSYSKYDGVDWIPLSVNERMVFEIVGEPVPEPSTMAFLLGAAVLVPAWLWRKRRRAI